MKAFTYKSATSEAEAVAALAGNAQALAGGTNLLNLMKERVLEPDVVVGVRLIPGMAGIEPAGAGLRIGAAATLAAILEHPAVKSGYPALAQALETVGTVQIRNMATLGGNLCAKTPCMYYAHDGFACAKRGNSGACPAKTGDNEFNAIFATDFPCVSVHASSAAPALVVLGASVRIAGPKGAREVPVEAFFTMDAKDVARENVLRPGELLTHVTLPGPSPKSATVVVAPKGSHDWPVALASVSLDPVRICLGAVSVIPWRAKAAEEALAGKAVTEATASAAAAAAVAGAKPLSMNAYKVRAVTAAVRRAILRAGGKS